MAGIITDAANNIITMAMVIILGVAITGRDNLKICNPIKKTIATGRARCIRWRTKKRSISSDSLLRKDIDMGSIKRGMSLNNSDVFKATNCALSSQTSQ